MRKNRLWIPFGCGLFAMTMLASAHAQKAGLWEVSSTLTFQKPGSVGMFSGTQAGGAAPAGGQALPVCLTQELIDKYGVILPPSLRDCQLINVVKSPNGMRADMACSGRMNGKGSIETSWPDDEHAQGKIHFTSKSGQGAQAMIMTWTQDSSAAFKSADCGSVRPRAIPQAK
jgi:hypothetical protein